MVVHQKKLSGACSCGSHFPLPFFSYLEVSGTVRGTESQLFVPTWARRPSLHLRPFQEKMHPNPRPMPTLERKKHEHGLRLGRGQPPPPAPLSNTSYLHN